MSKINSEDAWKAFEQSVMKSKNKDGWKKINKDIESENLEDISGRVIKNRVLSVKNEAAIDIETLEDKSGKVTINRVAAIDKEINISGLNEAPPEIPPDTVAGISAEVDISILPDLSGRVIINTTDEITQSINTDGLADKTRPPKIEATDFSGR